MKKNIAYWTLYDFANSIVLMVFLFYFSQWLVIEQGNPAWWYNAALAISSVLFILSAPFISARIDATGRKLAGLRVWTLGAFVGFLSVALICVLSDSLDALAVILYTLTTYVYLTSFLFYTPMLNDLSTNENRSFISGIGQGGNGIGQVTGLLVTIPFVNGAITLFGEPGRAQALLPATLIFGVLALPMLLFYKEQRDVKAATEGSVSFPTPLTLFKKVFAYRPLMFFLLAYFLFSDALLTFANNFPLYLETVHGVADTIKALLTAAVLALAAVGAVIFGKIADRRGNLKTLIAILIAWCVIFPVIAFIPTFKMLVPVFLVVGIIFGPIWGISRALVGELAPPEIAASSYSYYVVAERFATFVGPAVWSGALIVGGEGAAGYKAAILLMMVVIIISVFILRRINGGLIAE